MDFLLSSQKEYLKIDKYIFLAIDVYGTIIYRPRNMLNINYLRV